MTQPTDGVTRITATVDEVAAMLVNAGFPKDAERLLLAQAKRDRKKAKRMPRYPEWRVSFDEVSTARFRWPPR